MLNLNHLVHEVIADDYGPEPADIVQEVLRRIDPDDYRTALQLTLRGYVRTIIGNDRTAGGLSLTNFQSSTSFRSNSGSTQTQVKAHSGRSSKRAAVAEEFQRQLNSIVHVGSTYRYLRDCTAEDLTFAANERRDLAKKNEGWAEIYERRARLVKKHGVKTFGRLPADVLREELSMTS